MTIELHLPVFETLRIDACCRAAGLDFAAILARYANIITGAGLPAEESPAVPAAPAGLPAVKKLPLPQPPSLTGPGDILDADTIDWTNPDLYK